MTTWHAFIMGLIQGLTEFLPVSSSGHLALAQYFFSIEDFNHFLLFNLICHLGTLMAVIFFFFSAIKANFQTPYTHLQQLLLATLPLFPLVLVMKPLKELFNQPQLLGPCFLITAALLFLSTHLRLPLKKNIDQRKWSDSLTIGCFQAVAIFPGISRSGATISAARLLNWSKEDAFQFSFLLSIPTILGGAFLEMLHIAKLTNLSFTGTSFMPFIIGFTTSFLVGYLALMLLKRLVIHDRWHYFGWYCLCLGLMTTFYFYNVS